MDTIVGSLGRVALRLEAGQPLPALAPVTAALCGALASGAIAWHERTPVMLLLLLLLVEPLMGGLWAVAFDPRWRADAAGDSNSFQLPALPYSRPGSAGHRLMSWLSRVVAGWQAGRFATGWLTIAFAAYLAFALAVGVVLGYVVVAVIAGIVVLAARLIWRTGVLVHVLQALYDVSLPWLMGMAAFGQVEGPVLERYWPALLVLALFTLAYAAGAGLLAGSRLLALLFLDAAQVLVVIFLVSRQQTLAAWLVGICLVGQLAFHPPFVAGGSGQDYLRRVAVFVLVAMLATAMAVAPAGT